MNQCNRALMLALLVLAPGLALSQTDGQIAKFNISGDLVDSVVTEDAAGNIGIGTMTPAAKLDVAGGNLNARVNLSLVNSTATAGNIIKGGSLFLHNFGNDNTFIGANAGNLTLDGDENTGMGVRALSSDTTGRFNTAIGVAALFSNTTGLGNTASGFGALGANTTADFNTASGTGALGGNTTGTGNTASGWQALLLNTTGSFNTASGVAALFSNDSGNNNTASGVGVLGEGY